MATSDKDDPWAAANLLHGLPWRRKQQLMALLPPRPGPGGILRGAGTLDSAVNPWLSMHAPLAWPTDVDHEQVGSIQAEEHKAQRSLMHRCGPPQDSAEPRRRVDSMFGCGGPHPTFLSPLLGPARRARPA